MAYTLDTVNALTSLENVKDHIRIPDANTDFDNFLTGQINASSIKINEMCARQFKKRSYVEYHDGRNQNRLLFRQWPADKPTEVIVDTSGRFDNTNDIVATDEYELDMDSEGNGIGLALLDGRNFVKGTRNIRVTYEAGYDPIPADLEQACIWLVEFFYDLRTDRAIRTKSKGKNNENTQFHEDLPPIVMNIIERYKRMEFPTLAAPIDSV